MDRLISFFKPETGVPITLSGVFVGWFPTHINIGIAMIPRQDFIEFLQIAAFSVAIVSGILTAYHIHTKLVDRRRAIRNAVNKDKK